MNSFVEKLNINYGINLAKKLPSCIKTVAYAVGELTLVISHSSLFKVIYFLKYHSQGQFKVLADMTVVDYPKKINRFECVYNLLSIKYNTRIRVKLYIKELAQVESIHLIHSCSNWLEREAWDFFGVFFQGHPDLRRILTDYGFQGHPFRKDFPLSGFLSVRYDDINKIILCEPLELSQDYRFFDFESPWNKS